MELKGRKINGEFWFQVVLTAILAFFAVLEFDRDKFTMFLEWKLIWFFLNYFLAAMLINYALIPRFLYTKRYLEFGFYVLLVIVGVIVHEELVLEKIFYPLTRGTGFPGILHTLIEVMPIILIFSGFKFGWDAFHKQHQVHKLQQAITESELQLLRSQVSPHFLFNNLNNLYAHAIEQSPKTPEIILELSSFLRYMLYDCKAEYVSLQKEIEHLENYVKLSELQVGERGNVTFDVGYLDAGLEIAPMILIVFVENAFKHSLSSQSEGIEISIHVYSENRKLHFACENNYREVSNTENLANGIGLNNVTARLELIYGERAFIKREDSPPLYKVELSIDLNKAGR